MGPARYMSLIGKLRHEEIDLGRVSLDILELFAHSKALSVYRIFSEIKSTPIQMAYKNVHKKVQRLRSLQLIEEKEIERIEHGAKYYGLTEYGLYQLFLKRIHRVYFNQLQFMKLRIDTNNFVDKSILVNYEHSALFETFLFPYVNRDTIFGLRDIITLTAFFDYLHDCCKIIDIMLHKEDIKGHINWRIYSWNKNYGGNKWLLYSLKEVFGLEHVNTENSQVDKIDEHTLKISNKDFSVIIKLDLERNKAIAKLDNSNKKYEYDIERSGSDIEIISNRDGRDLLLETQFQNAKLDVLLACKIVTQVGSYNSVKTDSFDALSRDDKFMSMVYDLHGEFERGYSKLMKLRERVN